MGFGRVFIGAYGNNVVFREGDVPEGLVEFCQRASGDGLSVGGFLAGVCLAMH